MNVKKPRPYRVYVVVDIHGASFNGVLHKFATWLERCVKLTGGVVGIRAHAYRTPMDMMRAANDRTGPFEIYTLQFPVTKNPEAYNEPDPIFVPLRSGKAGRPANLGTFSVS